MLGQQKHGLFQRCGTHRRLRVICAASALPAACLDERQLTERHLRAAFDYFDRDQSGTITESDIVQVGAAGVASLEAGGAAGPLVCQAAQVRSDSVHSCWHLPRVKWLCLPPADPDVMAPSCCFWQVLEEMGMDASTANELLATVSGASTGASSSSSRSISYEDFRRMLVAPPKVVVTKARTCWQGG